MAVIELKMFHYYTSPESLESDSNVNNLDSCFHNLKH